LAPTVATWVQPPVLVVRSILNPVSLEELSDQVRLTWEVDEEEAETLDGA
jgi:hypothetical protein